MQSFTAQEIRGNQFHLGPADIQRLQHCGHHWVCLSGDFLRTMDDDEQGPWLQVNIFSFAEIRVRYPYMQVQYDPKQHGQYDAGRILRIWWENGPKQQDQGAWHNTLAEAGAKCMNCRFFRTKVVTAESYLSQWLWYPYILWHLMPHLQRPNGSCLFWNRRRLPTARNTRPSLWLWWWGRRRGSMWVCKAIDILG